MKKIVALMLSMVMMFSIIGCSNNKAEVVDKNNKVNKEQKVEEKTIKENQDDKKQVEKENDAKETEVKQEDINEDKSKKLLADVRVESDKVTFTDALGEEVTIAKKPTKVISLYNSFLNLWYECGGTVAGRIESRKKVPEEAMEAEIVGSMTEPNIEKIISMQPDLVILRPLKSKNIIPVLKQNKIPYLAVDYNNFEEYLKAVKLFTSLNERDDLFKVNGTDIKEQIDKIIKKVPADKKPSILIMFASARNISVRLPNSSVGQMLEQLGTENIAVNTALSDEEMQIFSMEKIIEKDPDYIFVQTMGDIEKIKERLVKDAESNPAWKSLSAVKNSKYIILDSNLYLYKANTRYAEAYENLAKMLYPDVFK